MEMKSETDEPPDLAATAPADWPAALRAKVSSRRTDRRAEPISIDRADLWAKVRARAAATRSPGTHERARKRLDEIEPPTELAQPGIELEVAHLLAGLPGEKTVDGTRWMSDGLVLAADHWVATGGLVAALDIAQRLALDEGSLRPGEEVRFRGVCFSFFWTHALWDRLARHVARANDLEWSAAREAMATFAGKRHTTAGTFARLFPEGGAADALLTRALSARGPWISIPELLGWVTQRATLETFVEGPEPLVVGQAHCMDDASVLRLVARFGDAAVAPLLRLLERSDFHEPFARSLALLGNARVIEALARNADKDHVRLVLKDVVKRTPRAAAAPLLRVATGAGNSADVARMLLSRLLRSTEVPTPVDDAERRVLTELVEAAAARTEATVDELPAILAHPPWRTPGPTGKASGAPRLPAFVEVELLPRLILQNGKALSVTATEEALALLALSTPERPHAGVAALKTACTAESLAAFSLGLFHAWVAADAPRKLLWCFMQLALIGAPDNARSLGRYMRDWTKRAMNRHVVIGLDVLEAIGTPTSIMRIRGMAEQHRFKTLRRLARARFEAIAHARGLTFEELDDRLVPDPGDDEAAWAALEEDLDLIFRHQACRLEAAMCSRRRWRTDDFRACFVDHSLVRRIARRVVWGVYDERNQLVVPFCLAGDGTFVDAAGAAWSLPSDASVGVPHPVELTPDDMLRLGERMRGKDLRAPFPQLERKTFSFATLARRGYTWNGEITSNDALLALMSRGWRRGDVENHGIAETMEKTIPLSTGFAWASIQITPGVSFSKAKTEHRVVWVGLVHVDAGEARLHPIDESELLRDVDWAVFGTAVERAE